jgi:adenylate kinase
VIIVFLGPPGSGKGTQAKKLQTEQHFFHFDTGSHLRREAASGSELGERIASYINAGNLVPLEVIKDLIGKFLSETSEPRIMFDGFPRNLDQAKVLSTGLEERGFDLTHVIYLELDQSALLQRITNRRYCEYCGSIYNIASNPPTGVCPAGHPACQLTQRKDDTPEVFKQRLKVYMSETLPVLDYFLERGSLRRIDGNQAIDKVYHDIEELLGLGTHAAS